MKKNPLIPPLVVDNSFITDVKTKANTFNTFFAEQCKLTNYAHLNWSSVNSIDMCATYWHGIAGM